MAFLIVMKAAEAEPLCCHAGPVSPPIEQRDAAEAYCRCLNLAAGDERFQVRETTPPATSLSERWAA